MMQPKPVNNQSLGATGPVAKKKGLSFSPLMVVALAGFIHLFIGLSLVVSVVLAVIISMVMIVRNAMKQQSSLPPIPPKEDIDLEFEPLDGMPLPGSRGQTNQRADTNLPDLLDSNDWGRKTPAPREAPRQVQTPRFERKPIERLSQSLPKRNPPRASSILQVLTPANRRHAIDVPNLQNEQELHKAIIAMAILGPCKANESAADKKQLI